ncbi:hypothetical protein PVK06_047324 [Gossypium arboreum]|uniref:Retrotransposon gag domain-containing protein n=1 Tax=Gossypium arboreum TaxID=29729 RepID=A0ABR0MDB8_GOSAR|nr:hypothetical protein PVK06_047324 [Gossypium arboreum]
MNPVSPVVSTNQVPPPTSAPRSSSSPALDDSQFCQVVQSFPKHDTVKRTDDTFVQWHGEFLSSFTRTATAHDVWSKACSLFGAASDTNISDLKHKLHSVKKGHQSVTEYLGQIKNICGLFAAFGHPISGEEHSNIVLTGLSQDFDSIITVASFSLEPLALDRLIEILIEYERWEKRFVTEAWLRQSWPPSVSDSRTARAPGSVMLLSL